MKQLSTLDTLFVSMDSARWPLHGGGLFVLDPSTAPGGLDFDGVRAHLEGALPSVPPMRRRLLRVPLGFADPMWVEDPDFVLDRHLHHVALPAPADDAALLAMVAKLGDAPLDEDRPLWECWFIEGLQDGAVAIFLKMHHACVDGMGGLAMIKALFTEAATDEPERIPDEWVPDRVPTGPELALRAAPSAATRPVRAAAALAGLARGVVPSVLPKRPDAEEGDNGGESGAKATLFGGPDIALSRVLPGQVRRGMGTSSITLDDIGSVREAFDVTLNDVVLTACAGGLRAHLDAEGEVPEESLTVLNPVNMRTESSDGEPRNQFSLLLSLLHTEIEDPVERLAAISSRMHRTKKSLRKHRRNPVEDLFTLLTPGTIERLVSIVASDATPDITAPANVCITNVAFTATPLFFAGARMTAIDVMMMQSMGVNVVFAVVSYDGRLHLCVTANRANLADAQALADATVAEFDRLLEAAASA